MQIKAISLDLDDTLWPIAPIVLRAEQRLHDWLLRHCPPVAAAYPVASMRALRDRIATENPHLAHDYTAQRKLSLTTALRPHGYGEDIVDAAFEAFYAARNEVELYADALPALQRLAARLPLISLSNGNADLRRIGPAPSVRRLRDGARIRRGQAGTVDLPRSLPPARCRARTCAACR